LDKKAGCPNKGATCFFSNDDPRKNIALRAEWKGFTRFLDFKINIIIKNGMNPWAEPFERNFV
jgi:hypothetical protein